MTGRVHDRATFAALARAARQRAGPVTLRYVADRPQTRVAYAIGRSVGTAVRRNRLRRRLRAAVAACEADMPHGAYLFGAGPDALSTPFGVLREHVRGLVDTVRAEP